MRALVVVACALAAHAGSIENRLFRVDVSPGSGALWTYRVQSSGRSYAFAAPSFEVDGVPCQAKLASVRASAPASLPNGTAEHRFVGAFAADHSLSLELIFRVASDNPVLRFRYILRSTSRRTMTKSKGADAITYLDTSVAGISRFIEVRLSDFSEQLHTYTLHEMEVDSRHFDHQIPMFGPIFVGSAAETSMLIAYEHG